MTDAPVYFCDWVSPGQRGSNENSNGTLRDYFPGHTELRLHAVEHAGAVANEINNRPRKTLTWATPADPSDLQLMLVRARDR